MLESAGFDVVRVGPLYADPFGRSHPKPGRALRSGAVSLLRMARLGNDGVPHVGVLVRPAI